MAQRLRIFRTESRGQLVTGRTHPQAAHDILGADTGLAEARAYLGDTLGANSTARLDHVDFRRRAHAAVSPTDSPLTESVT